MFRPSLGNLCVRDFMCCEQSSRTNRSFYEKTLAKPNVVELLWEGNGKRGKMPQTTASAPLHSLLKTLRWKLDGGGGLAGLLGE